MEIDPCHPALPGHFPGRPIVPGVLLLDLLRREVLRRWPDRALVGIGRAKFLRIVGGGEELAVELAAPVEGEVEAACRSMDGTPVLRVTLLLEERSSPD